MRLTGRQSISSERAPNRIDAGRPRLRKLSRELEAAVPVFPQTCAASSCQNCEIGASRSQDDELPC